MAISRSRRAVFLDLNGTLVLPLLVTDPCEYRPIPRTADAIAMLCRGGFVCPVVTVQSRVGKGMFTEAAFRAWFRRFADALALEGAVLEGPYVCPHRYAEACGCKKQSGVLYREAARALAIDVPSSFIVGDSLDDMEAARLLGCRGVAVRTGWRMGDEAGARSEHVADDLFAAAQWIMASAGSAQQAAAVGEPREQGR